MRFGYCKTCWWHKEGICYMHRCHMHDTDYCPDHLNRRKRSKEEKLEDWIKKHNEEINLEN